MRKSANSTHIAIISIMVEIYNPIKYHYHRCHVLRLLSECLILIGSAMFGATFNLVTRVGLP